MGLGGRLIRSVFWLGALCVHFEARAGEGGVSLVFDASAGGLPQAEVRAAVERELGRPLAESSEGASEEITVLVDQGRLVVRHRTRTGSSERYLPMPSEPSDVPLIVSLAAGNLARDPSSALEAAPADEASKNPAPKAPAAAAPSAAVKPVTPPPTKPRFRRHQFGIHVAQDIPYVHALAPCNAPEPEFSCYYADTRDDPFFHTAMPNHEYVEGFSFATTRLLLSYDFFFIPALSVGTRIGYAFGGGPPAGVVPPDNENLNEVPPHASGKGGQPFLPLHAELRGSFWYLAPAERSYGAYVGAGFGVAQVDARHDVEVTDCAETLSPSWDTANGNFSDCVRGDSSFDRTEIAQTKLDAWQKLGRGFVTATAGATLELTDGFSAVLNVNAMFMFPDDGFVLEPSLGGTVAF